MFGPETRRTLLPNEVTGIDTVKALFVRFVAYPIDFKPIFKHTLLYLQNIF